MKNRKKLKLKRWIALCIVMILCFGNVPATQIFNQNEVFAETSSENDFVIDENGVLALYNGAGGDVIIPDGVTSIGVFAFEGCNNLISIEIPESVTSIGSENPNGQTSAYVTHDFPKTLKIGDTFGYYSSTPVMMQYHNLLPNTEVVLCPKEYMDWMHSNWKGAFQYHGWGPSETVTDEDGNAYYSEELTFSIFKPGKFVYTPTYAYGVDNGEELDSVSLTSIEINVEEPVITDNIPSVISVGDSFVLKTALTNVNVENRKVAEYDNSENWSSDGNLYVGNKENYVLEEAHNPAYRPSVTIIEGNDIVEQSNQDYSNTLSTSETLSFTREGVVKLKITYNQIMTCSMCLDEKSMYSPEKIITITVQNENQIPNETPKDERMLGDVNSDGDITLADAQLALRAALRIIELDELQAEATDVNGKDGISLTDAQLILRRALRIITSFDEVTADAGGNKGQDEMSLLKQLESFSSNTNMDLAKEFVEADIESGANRFVEKTSERLQYQWMYEGTAYEGLVNGIPVVEYWLDGNPCVCYNEAVDGITLFGLKPGDDVQKVADIMAEYGFYQQDEYSDNYYINGSDIGSYYVTFEENNGKITNITIGTYSAFAG